jgi:ketosteroid isomerase-like protein
MIRQILVVMVMVLAGCRTVQVPAHGDLEKQVSATELAFAQTMADRNIGAFGDFISDEAVFFSENGAIRGRENIVKRWKSFFDGKTAPFSWSPDHVEALDSGQLALSTGPVLDANGKLIARFNSIWRREPTGRWKIVFDKGCEVCQHCEVAR